MRTRRDIPALAACLLALASCGSEDGLAYSFSFDRGPEGWTGRFADMPADADPGAYELSFGHEPLPGELEGSGFGLYLSGRNFSDDLFMFVKREIGGFQPGARYRVRADLVLASNAPTGCFGIGGAPGEDVHLKLGASGEEPVVVEGDGGWLELSVDKGNQASEGEHATNIGTIENGLEDCEGDLPYRRIERGGRAPTVRAGPSGSIWIFVGTDSGFEGATSIYYDRIEIDIARE